MSFRKLALLAACAACAAQAQFAAFVLPARFELTAKSGQLLQDVIEIGNDEQVPVDLRVRTADWTLRANGGVDFQVDTLAPDSCRPWVHIERPSLRVAGKAKRRYRFEVQVPPEAKDGLCRFALLIEPTTDALTIAPASGIQMPIQGRIGVIVYLRIGDAKPQLVMDGLRVEQVNSRPTVVAVFRNTGNAQGRPEGLLSGTDAKGAPIDLAVAPLPILPGETRSIPVWPQEGPDGKAVTLSFPVKLKGLVEWEGGKQEVNTSVGP
jgi:hypothetical protein